MRTFVSILLLSLSCSLFALDASEVLSTHYLSKFEIKEHTKPTNDDDLKFVSRMDAFGSRNALVKFFSEEIPSFHPLKIDSDIWGDLELYSSEKGHLLNELFPTTTLYGEVYGAILLAEGASSHSTYLEQRQNVLRLLAKNPSLTEKIQSHLKKLKGLEAALLDVYDVRNPINTLQTQILFPGQEDLTDHIGKALSVNADMREASERAEILKNRTPDFIIFDMLIKHYLNIPISIPSIIYTTKWTLASISNPYFYAAYTFWSAYTYSFMISAPLKTHSHLKSVNALLTSLLRKIVVLVDTILQLETLQDQIPQELALKLTRDEKTLLIPLRREIALLTNPEEDGHLFQQNLSQAVATLRLFYEVRDPLKKILSKIGKLDLYTSVAGKMEDSGFAFTHFEKQGPVLRAKGLWNTLLPRELAVSNDVSLGMEEPRSFIITGHNASGKSTLMRAVGIAIYLSQLFGIAPAEEMSLSPFKMLNSFMKNSDRVGERSSFQAEVDANKKIMTLYSKSKAQDFAFLISDEPFRSTNMEDATVASKIVFQTLCRHPQVMFLVSTHLDGLTSFSNAEECKIVNKHMEALRDGINTRYTFQLVGGVSPDTNAMELLRKKLNIGNSHL